MIRTLVVALVLAVVLVPAALAGTTYKVGQKCSAKNQATYLKHHFSCVKGKLQTHK